MIVPSRSLRLRSALLDSRVVILLFYLQWPFRMLNSAISWSLQPRLPQLWHSQKVLSCLYEAQQNSSPHQVLKHLVRMLSSMHSRNFLDSLCPLCWPFNRPFLHNLWVGDCFHFSEEGLIYFFLPDQVVVDAHHDLTGAPVLTQKLSSGSLPSPRQSPTHFSFHVNSNSVPHPFLNSLYDLGSGPAM